jgi:CheY-like chemotaxis protein
MNVFSEDGKGTTFEIYLPRYVAGDVEIYYSADQNDFPGGKETVMLVEDDDYVREITGEFLQSFGYEVLMAASPLEALRLSHTYSGIISLLVTDMVMPVMSGWDLALKMKSSRPGLKSLFISGYTPDFFEQKGDAPDLNMPFLGKPYSRTELACKVRQVLDAPFSAGDVIRIS